MQSVLAATAPSPAGCGQSCRPERSSAGSQPGQKAGQGSADVAEQHQAEQSHSSVAPYSGNQAVLQQVPPSASAVATIVGDSDIAGGSPTASPAADTTRRVAGGAADQSPLRSPWGTSSRSSTQTALQPGGLASPHWANGSPAVPATSRSAQPPHSPSAQVSSGLRRCHARQATCIAVEQYGLEMSVSSICCTG